MIQTDWNPEAEHGWLYQLVGDDPVIDSRTVRRCPGRSSAHGGVDTGVDIEIRSGGRGDRLPGTVTSQLYERRGHPAGLRVHRRGDPDSASQFPTVAIFSGMEKNPQMIMWDPATYPDVETIADLGEAGVQIRYFEGAAYMDYFVRERHPVSRDQVDSSYDGTPGRRSSPPKAPTPSRASARPSRTSTRTRSPSGAGRCAYQYINDAGWKNYGESIATRPENLETYADCFALLVPILQQSSDRLPRRSGRDERADPRGGRDVQQRSGCTRKASPTTRSRR